MSHEPDANETAARITREATERGEALPDDLEAAWTAWSKTIKGVDERGWHLLRAAFEAGAEAGAGNPAATLGRLGGLKGGRARAEKLSPEERKAIAKQAARARWNKDK